MKRVPEDHSKEKESRVRRIEELQEALKQCRKEVDCGECGETTVEEHVQALKKGLEISN